MAAKNLTEDQTTFLSINEIADKLSSHPKTVARLIRQGKMESVKVGGRRLVSLFHYRRYLETNMTEGSLN